jgi:hypothetical protein
MSVIVWSSVLEVEAFLARITNIAACLPESDSAALADPPSTMIIDWHGRGPSVAQYLLKQTHGRTEWRISGPVEYRGTILSFGDASLTQLRSTLCIGSKPAEPGPAFVNSRFVRELAHRIEARHERTFYHARASLS